MEKIMVEFTVKDMTCGHCVGTITKALNGALPGATVNVELARHLVRVEGVDDVQAVADVIRQAGYTPEAHC
jgi:copper chaperone